MTKQTESYVDLPYTKIVHKDPHDDLFVSRVEELPGCSAHGKSEEEALRNLRKSMQVWLSDAVSSGDPIPEPAGEAELPSGKWVQRVPRSLHLKLNQLAKREGVSLNQFVTSALAEAVGNKTAKYALELQEKVKASLLKVNCGSIPQAVSRYLVSANDWTDTSSPAFEILVHKLAKTSTAIAAHTTSYSFEREHYGKGKKLALTRGD